jgi:hypothetical protein
MTCDAMEPHVFTLGIEEEFQIVDPETHELRAHIQQILDGGRITLKEHVKAEMHQSITFRLYRRRLVDQNRWRVALRDRR